MSQCRSDLHTLLNFSTYIFPRNNNNNNNSLFPSLVQENTTVYVIVCSSSNMYFTSFNKFTINYTSVLTLLQYAYSPRACLI